MSPHAERSAESVQDHIAKATLRLVAECGADHVTTADVVKTMGITRAAMARYCPTESDLWRTTAEFIEQRMAASWSAIESSDQLPADRLRSLLAVQIGLIMNMPAVREMLFSRGLHGGNTALRRGLCGVRVRFRSLLSEILRDGVRTGQFPPGLDPEKAARRLTDALQGMVVSWSLDARSDDVIEEAWARLDALVGAPGQRAIATAGRAARTDAKGS
jgi:AcrR family transcriptional regulator